MSGWLRVAVLGLLGLLATLALTLAWCLSYPNTLKPLGSHLTERFLGRHLEIDGDVTLTLSLQPRVSARAVRFGNAAWSETPHMATADYVLVQIDLPALLDRRVHLLDLDVQDAELILEDQVDGSPNWSFFEDDDDATDWSFMIEGLEVQSSVIRASLGELEPLELVIPQLAETTDSAGHLHLDGHGTLNGDPWRVDGRIGTLDELLRGGFVEMDLALIVDDVEVEAAGSIGALETLAELDLSMRIYGPDAEVLGELFRMPEAFAADVALDAGIEPTATGHALKIAGHVSQFEISIEGTVKDLNNLDGWDGSLRIAGPEADVFGKAMQIRGFPDGPFQVQGNIHRHGSDLDLKDVLIRTDDVELTLNADFVDFPRREGALATVHLTGPDIGSFRELLRIPMLPTNAPFELNLTVDATGNEVLTSSLIVGTHKLTAAGPIGEFPDYVGTRLNTTLSGKDVAEILALAGLENALSGPYQASLTFTVDDDGLGGSDIQVETGPFHFEGTAVLPDPLEPMQFTADGTVTVADLRSAGDALDIADLPSESLAVEARLVSAKDGFVLERSRIRFKSIVASAQGALGTLSSLSGLNLEMNAQGKEIDDLFEDAIATGEMAIPFKLSGGVRGSKTGINLRQLTLTTEGGTLQLDGEINLTDAFSGSELQLTGNGPNLASVLPKFPDYEPPQKPWDISGTIGMPSLDSLSLEAVSFEVGSIRISASGLLDKENQTRTNLLLEASGDTFNDVGQIADIAWPELPFQFKTKLDGSRDRVNVTSLEARWGASDLQASGSFSVNAKPDLVLTGRSTRLDLVDLQKAVFGEREDIDHSDDLKTVIPDTPVPLDSLDLFNADLDIEVKEFRGQRASMNDVTLMLRLEDGMLALERVAYRDEIGYFSLSGEVRQEGDVARMELRLLGEDAELGLFTSAQQARETVPRYNMDVSITGAGATISEIAANLGGRILVSSDGGQINNALLEAFAGDFFSNVLETLNPFVQSEPFTPMQCMVINASIDNGIVDMTPGFVMRTNRVNMFVMGKVNLRNERLDLSLATQARRGFGISAASITNPYFKIGGTMAAPALQLDPASAAIAASVATATAGLSIVIRGIWDRLKGEQNPCPRFLEYRSADDAGDG